MADLKMCWLALTGGLAAELASLVPPASHHRGIHYRVADADSRRRVMAARQQP